MIPLIIATKDKKIAEKVISELKKKVHIYDIYLYEPEAQSVTIDQIREIRSLFNRNSTEEKLIIIYDFHTARPEAQNALLKTLEEHNAYAQFVLVTHDETAVLETIRSRAKVMRLKSKNIKAKEDIATESFPQLLQNYQGVTREKALHTCEGWLSYFHEKLHESEELQYVKAVKEILTVYSLIKRNNLNPQLAIDHLLIKIKGAY